MLFCLSTQLMIWVEILAFCNLHEVQRRIGAQLINYFPPTGSGKI